MDDGGLSAGAGGEKERLNWVQGAKDEVLRISRRLASLVANTVLMSKTHPPSRLASLVAARGGGGGGGGEGAGEGGGGLQRLRLDVNLKRLLLSVTIELYLIKPLAIGSPSKSP